jgi:exodeoxyribonuclease VII small subunit
MAKKKDQTTEVTGDTVPTPDKFEEAYRALEDIVAQMEQGDLPLEQTIALYESGQKLAVFCAEQLEKAELRMKQLGQA